MKNEELVKQLTSPSKNSRLEKFGKTITFLCLALIVFIVAMILLFVAQKGLATFFVNKVSLIEFLFLRKGLNSYNQLLNFWLEFHLLFMVSLVSKWWSHLFA